MSNRWLAGILGGWLAAAPAVCAQDPLPGTSVAAIVPQTTTTPPEHPSELPNIDPRLDLVPLVRPTETPPCPVCPPPRGRRGSDFDPSYLFLPDRNPGQRQPPCPCLPLGDWWLDTAYFLGKTQNDPVPPLVTTGGSGIPGTPGVTTLHGGERLEQPFRSGLRLETGLWLDRCHDWGIDGSFFFMQSTQAQFSAASPGEPLLAQPFISQPGSVPSANILAAPGESRGSVFVNSPLNFLGSDVNSRNNLLCEDHGRLDLLLGYRFAQMSEQIGIRSNSQSTTGTTRDLDDSFRTMNLFNGAQVGLAAEYRFDHFYVAGSGKIAFGVTWSELNVDGFTRTQNGASTVVAPGGLLTSPANLGTTRDQNFAVVPEANFTLGYQVTDNWRAFVGYTFIYLSSVARPGQAIDLNVASSAAAGLTPARSDPNTEFWMHGINLGVEVRY